LTLTLTHMNSPLEDLAAATAAITQATAAVEQAAKSKAKAPKKPKAPKPAPDADGKPVERDKGCGILYSEKGLPSSLNEPYWAERLASTRDIIYDPLLDSYYRFSDGLWTRIARPEVVDWVGRFIVEENPDVPAKLLTRRATNEIALRLAGHPACVRRDAVAQIPHGIILCNNGRLEVSRDGQITFDEGDRGRRCDMKQTRLEIDYNPSATPALMMDWLTRIFSGRTDDVEAIGNMMGAVLFGSSRCKKMVYISGLANLGKSQIPLMVERLAGRQVCVDFETRRLGEKFEFRRFVGKVFLRAEDVDGDFMTRGYADALKQLTGFGSLRVEGKNSHEEFELKGDKIICATSNFRPRVKTGVDRSAWEERLVYLIADGQPYATGEQDGYFLDTLFSSKEEASGILNFALEGLTRLLTSGWHKSEGQTARVTAVMDQGSHVEDWARTEIQITGNGLEDPDRPGLTIAEAWKSYQEYCEEKKIEPWPQQTWTEMAKAIVEDFFRKSTANNLTRGGTHQRGWRGLSLRVAFNPNPAQP
jgi:phage/plasmid-associated DNA primase/cytochrome c5